MPDAGRQHLISRRRFVGRGAALTAGVALAGPARALAQAAPADVVLRNGRVLTLVGDRRAQAVAVSGGQIVYVGSNEGARGFVGAATEVFELRGRMVMPGIHDGHIRSSWSPPTDTSRSPTRGRWRLPA